MDRKKVVESARAPHPEPPADMGEADQLAWMLARVLNWPLPQGTVRDYALPKWLSQQAEASLQRYLSGPLER